MLRPSARPPRRQSCSGSRGSSRPTGSSPSSVTSSGSEVAQERPVHIRVRNLTMAYGERVVMRDLDFDVRRGDIFFIIGGSGCGKTTLLRHMIGLNEPARGDVWYGEVNFTAASD